MSALLTTLTVAGLTAAALMAGLFFMASVAIVPGLRRLPAPAAIAAMQQINRAILNPVFLAVYGLAALLCLAVGVVALLPDTGGTAWHVAGAVLYLVGGFGVTTAANVPLNNRLDREDPEADDPDTTWRGYADPWTARNNLRTVASTLATVALALGLAA